MTTDKGITHCENCGCDWLDNGLNPVGCPYCKSAAPDCGTCVNRGRVNGLSEETFCQQCVYGHNYLQNHYKMGLR